MAEDQLAPGAEEIEQARLALGPREDVRLRDLDHRQAAALGVERVAGPGQLLLLDQQRLARRQPFVA